MEQFTLVCTVIVIIVAVVYFYFDNRRRFLQKVKVSSVPPCYYLQEFHPKLLLFGN